MLVAILYAFAEYALPPRREGAAKDLVFPLRRRVFAVKLSQLT